MKRRIKAMELKLKRIARKSNYTIGKLYINNNYFCDVCEDKDRGLKDSMSLTEIQRIKVKNETAIPTGKYEIVLNVISPRFSSSAFYKTYANGGRLPRLLNVKGFDGVLMHTGNSAQDSSGCLILGKNKVVGKVIESKETFKKLYPLLQEAWNKKEKIYITIE